MFKRGKTDKVWADNSRHVFEKYDWRSREKSNKVCNFLHFAEVVIHLLMFQFVTRVALQVHGKFSFKQTASFVVS